MRLLRALAHLGLALALMTAAGAQTRMIGAMPVAASPHHHASASPAGHAGHADGSLAGEHRPQTRDACQTACCFTAAPMPAHAPEAVRVTRCSPIRYVIAPDPASGRGYAPDPGIPKPRA